MNIQPKNIDLAELVAHDTAHHFHPFTNHKAFHAEGGARVITHGDGVWIWDAKGNKILDGMAGLWCVNVGYGRDELADAAYAQMKELPYYNSFFKCSTPTPQRHAARTSATSERRWQARCVASYRVWRRDRAGCGPSSSPRSPAARRRVL